MHFSLSEAANIVTNFIGTVFIVGLLGGNLSDSYLGCFWTLLVSGFVELSVPFLSLLPFSLSHIYYSTRKLLPQKCQPIIIVHAYYIYICISVCLCHLCMWCKYVLCNRQNLDPSNPIMYIYIFVGFYTIVGSSTSSAAKASKVQRNVRKKLCKGKRVRIGYIFHGTLFGGIR